MSKIEPMSSSLKVKGIFFMFKIWLFREINQKVFKTFQCRSFCKVDNCV